MCAPDRMLRPTTSTPSFNAVSTIICGVCRMPVYTASMPASRSARTIIFAPRSWPSSPGFATSTRITGPLLPLPPRTPLHPRQRTPLHSRHSGESRNPEGRGGTISLGGWVLALIAGPSRASTSSISVPPVDLGLQERNHAGEPWARAPVDEPDSLGVEPVERALQAVHLEADVMEARAPPLDELRNAALRVQRLDQLHLRPAHLQQRRTDALVLDVLHLRRGPAQTGRRTCPAPRPCPRPRWQRG